jgi:hypothetical protein
MRPEAEGVPVLAWNGRNRGVGTRRKALGVKNTTEEKGWGASDIIAADLGEETSQRRRRRSARGGDESGCSAAALRKTQESVSSFQGKEVLEASDSGLRNGWKVSFQFYSLPNRSAQ